MRTQSRWGAVMPLVFHLGVDRIVSRYRPPIPEGLLGAEKMALAEWKTDISSAASTVGQTDMEGAPVEVGFCW